jgi:hypothetical protein
VFSSSTPKGVARVELERHLDETQREVAVDTPVAFLVGGGQRTPGDPATNAEVGELARMGTQADLDIAQTLPKRQLLNVRERN